MNSSANSSSPAANRSRFFTFRFTRAIWRFVWSRRMVWTLGILASLVVLFYQYENWNGARELKAAHRKMIARAGTADYMALLPEEVPDDENFFAIPVIKSWRVPDAKAAGGFRYQFPGDKMLPAGFVNPPVILEEAGRHRLDLEGWAKGQASAGKPLPPEGNAAEILLAHLGDGNGIIPGLALGLDRRYSALIPGRRSAIRDANGDPSRAGIPASSNCFATQRHLGIFLRAHALAGHAPETVRIAGIMLRFADGFGIEPIIICNLVALAMHDVTLRALNEALSCRNLRDADLRRIQEWLAVSNDVQRTERMFIHDGLFSMSVFQRFKEAAAQGEAEQLLPPLPEVSSPLEDLWRKILFYGPSGWIDSNGAFAGEHLTGFCGNGGEETWRSGSENCARAFDVVKAGTWFSIGRFHFPNFRRALAGREIPNMSNIWRTAAQNLFHRRCAILTCALHRQRLARGIFPDTLAEFDAAFLPAPQNDPAQSGAPLHYRKTDTGFLLWSVGDDRNDNSADPEKDWIWRHVTRIE